MVDRTAARPVTVAAGPGSAGAVQRQCACGQHTGGGECESCRKKEQTLQRAAVSAAAPASMPSLVHDVLNTSGQPLAESTRAFMEPRFGYEFSHVRVHADRLANDSAEAVNAHAYTVGSNIVFGAGRYAPGTAAGDALLAHELTHVIQQGQQAAALQPLAINSSTGADEHEADTVSRQIMAGASIPKPQAVPSFPLQRKMLNKVVTDFQKDAKACVVHLHGEERTALAVAKEIRKRRCVNLVHLDTKDRLVDLEINVGGEQHFCEADPNRVFSDKGRRNDALWDKGCRLVTGSNARTDSHAKDAAKTPSPAKASRADVTTAAAAELETWVNNEWGKQISLGRGGNGSSVENGTLPTLALHNNENLKLSKFESAKDVTRVPKGVPNPTFGDPDNKSDFFLVTQTADFDALRDPKAKANVFLQADPVLPKGQDGSLSVALQSQRFINVEKEGREHDKPVSKGGKFTGPDAIYARNYEMAAQALDLFGVPDGPCIVPATPQTGGGSATGKATTSGTPQPSTRKATTLSTDKAAFPKDILPGIMRDFLALRFPWFSWDLIVTTNCTLFFNQSGLDKRRDAWSQRLGRMPLQNIINWMLGVEKAKQPSEAAEALKEVKAQQGCMLKAMAASLKAAGSSMPKGDLIRSDLRPFSEQESIWTRKFKFTGDKFGNISSTARGKCAPDNLIASAEEEWDPSNTKHKTCWAKLSSEEKEKEILMTSSAPGVSRHHTGTDFDIGRKGKPGDKDLTAQAWTGSGDFADAYRWLVPNAATYGFIQPFDTKGGYGAGYTTERWHWSYYPIAQALLDFARSRRAEIGDELHRQWADSTGKAPRPEFKFIWDNWEKYLFNVEEEGIF